MSKIAVRKCPFTGRLFEDDLLYADHLRKLRVTQHMDREAKRIEQERNEVFAKMRETCETNSEIEEFIKANWKYFSSRTSHLILDKNKRVSPKLINIGIEFVWGSHLFGFDGRISNTHSAPVTGPWKGKTNWGGLKPEIPNWYMGWSGSITFALDRAVDMFASDIFHNTGIMTGIGGSNAGPVRGVVVSRGAFGPDSVRSHRYYKYAIELFADDWPALTKQRVLEILRNE